MLSTLYFVLFYEINWICIYSSEIGDAMFVWCPGPEAGAGGGPLSCAGPGLRAGSREAPGQWRGGRASAAVVGCSCPRPRNAMSHHCAHHKSLWSARCQSARVAGPCRTVTPATPPTRAQCCSEGTPWPAPAPTTSPPPAPPPGPTPPLPPWPVTDLHITDWE